MSLPLLPGFSVRDPRRTDFRKKQMFSFKNGHSTAIIEPPAAPAVEAATQRALKLQGETERRRGEFLSSSGGGGGGAAAAAAAAQFVPSYVALEGQMLLFDAYYKEEIPESAEEGYRVRRVKIQFFLEDDTLAVVEKKEENSGLPQGKLLKRHRVPNAAAGGRPFCVEDLNIGHTVEFYARPYRVVDCDEFTREYLSSIGVEVPPAEEVPLDPYSAKKRVRELMHSKGRAAPLSAVEQKHQLRRFLEIGDKVLRFFCVWDDRDSLYGEVRPFVINYYLADSSVEILEVRKPNSGRDPFPAFLRRQQLPRRDKPSATLAAFGSRAEDLFQPTDFVVGQTVDVLGRRFLVTDCDAFTRTYLRDKFNVDSGQPISLEQQPEPVARAATPPHTGIGSEEDSLGSVHNLVPKPPRKDFKKYFENDGKILRFSAKLVSAKPEDAHRKFIVTYFLSDDTVLVFEQATRNSGISGGKFMERSKVKFAGTERYIAASDLYIGGKIDIRGYTFTLHEADEFALKYMETHPENFPRSNVDLIENTIRGAVRGAGVAPGKLFAAMDSDGNGSVSPAEFVEAVRQLCPEVTDQEVVSLLRRYDLNGDGKITYEEFLAHVTSDADDGMSAQQLESLLNRLRTVLKQRGADSIVGLGRSFRVIDDDRSFSLSFDELRKALSQYGIALSTGEVELLFGYFDRDGSGSVDYDEFLRALRGEMNARRAAVVDEAFAKMDRTGDGVITEEDIRDVYTAREHPEVKAGRKTTAQVMHEFLSNFEVHQKDGRVTKAEFVDYYNAISACIDNDEHFEMLLRKAWNLPAPAVRSVGAARRAVRF